MTVLIACEFSGVVRRAFAARGHATWSCDLLPADDLSPYHIQGDVTPYLDDRWDLLVAHPPCTYLTVAGLHRNRNNTLRQQQTDAALVFVQQLLSAPIPMIALENPVGCISTRLSKPTQIIQPWQFGHPESKTTCLWLKGLPKLTHTHTLTPTRFQPNGRPQWDNQTPSGQNKLGPSADRWKKRSLTYEGIARAMAEQWGRP